MAKIILRAEAFGAVKERPLGARHYTHAVAYRYSPTEVVFSFTTDPFKGQARVADLRARNIEAELVTLTERTVAPRSSKAQAAARRAGRTRQLKNRVRYAASNITSFNWDFRFAGETDTDAAARQQKYEDQIVARVVEAYRELRDHLADPTSGTEA